MRYCVSVCVLVHVFRYCRFYSLYFFWICSNCSNFNVERKAESPEKCWHSDSHHIYPLIYTTYTVRSDTYMHKFSYICVMIYIMHYSIYSLLQCIIGYFVFVFYNYLCFIYIMYFLSNFVLCLRIIFFSTSKGLFL